MSEEMKQDQMDREALHMGSAEERRKAEAAAEENARHIRKRVFLRMASRMLLCLLAAAVLVALAVWDQVAAWIAYVGCSIDLCVAAVLMDRYIWVRERL